MQTLQCDGLHLTISITTYWCSHLVSKERNTVLQISLLNIFLNNTEILIVFHMNSLESSISLRMLFFGPAVFVDKSTWYFQKSLNYLIYFNCMKLISLETAITQCVVKHATPFCWKKHPSVFISSIIPNSAIVKTTPTVHFCGCDYFYSRINSNKEIILPKKSYSNNKLIKVLHWLWSVSLY